jgi:hypothetical protein
MHARLGWMEAICQLFLQREMEERASQPETKYLCNISIYYYVVSTIGVTKMLLCLIMKKITPRITMMPALGVEHNSTALSMTCW